jgi:hypothetical protein
MKKIIFLLLSFTVSQNSFGGDAGYTSTTCVSKSQRTILTILNNYSERTAIYTLILDGVPAVYNLEDDSVEAKGDDGVLEILKNGELAFKSKSNTKAKTVSLEISKDPRIGTIAERESKTTSFKVSLKCEEFRPEP